MELTEKRKKRAKRIVFWFSFLTLGSGYILYIALRFLLYEMAKIDKLVTLRADGEIKAIMRGNECVRYIMKVENHQIDPDGFDIFKGSFESYAADLVKAAEKKREDPGFVERKLKVKNGKLVNKDDRPIEVGTDGKPINGPYQLDDKLKRAIDEANSSTFFEELFGVFWVGLPPYNVFSYRFRWLKYGQQKAQKDASGNYIPSDKVGMFARDEQVDSLFFRYPQYGVVIEDAETGAGESLAATTDKGERIAKVQVTAWLVFETTTVNPQKTLFRTAAISSAGDWQQALVREISSRARTWLGNTDWDTLVRNKKGVEEDLREICEGINGVDKDDLPIRGAQISSVRDYGQNIVKISMISVDLKNKDLQTAYENVFKAEKKRDADIANATGQRALAAAPVKGEADGFELISKITGGKEMYMAKQLGNIRVYAPGRDGLFLSLAEEVTGESRPSVKKTGTADSLGDSSKKK
jgi:hypothetical protein